MRIIIRVVMVMRVLMVMRVIRLQGYRVIGL